LITQLANTFKFLELTKTGISAAVVEPVGHSEAELVSKIKPWSTFLECRT